VWDSNTDSKDGVSVWGHALDGAATGALTGSLFGGLGAIPGAFIGGATGMINGMYEWGKEDAAFDRFYGNGKRQDGATADRIESELERMAADPNYKAQGDGADIKTATRHVFNQDYAAKQQKESSLFNDLF